MPRPRYAVTDLDYLAHSLDDLKHRALLRWAARRIRTLERDRARTHTLTTSRPSILDLPLNITDDWKVVTGPDGHTTRERIPRKFVSYD